MNRLKAVVGILSVSLNHAIGIVFDGLALDHESVCTAGHVLSEEICDFRLVASVWGVLLGVAYVVTNAFDLVVMILGLCVYAIWVCFAVLSRFSGWLVASVSCGTHDNGASRATHQWAVWGRHHVSSIQ